MAEFKVVETFVSINGEGRKAGELAFFIRLHGCNLNCTYCDTRWASDENTPYKVMNENEIYEMIKFSKVKNVTITGGEPFFREGMWDLLEVLDNDEELSVEVETNGSADLSYYLDICETISFTMDYKLPDSGMEEYMFLGNLDVLRPFDTVKFVAGSVEDLQRAKEIIDIHYLTKKAAVYISPVFGRLEPETIVEFMKANNMNDVRLQLQLHKFIWDPDKRGV